MKPPCELIVKSILPVLRAMIAKELIETHDFNQIEAASRLGVTQASISYYISEKRGYKTEYVKQIPEVRSTAKKVADGIAKGRFATMDILSNMCNMCMKLRRSERFCKLHLKEVPEIEGKCSLCFDLMKSP